jgi:glycosyltransferase involved in cell wall biosynthesis
LTISGQTILSLSPFPAMPLFQGAIARTHYINKGLAKNNQIIFVYRDGPSYGDPDFDCKPIPSSRYRPLQLFNPILLAKLCRIIRSEQVSLILANHIWSGFHGLILKLLTGVHFLFDNHNVEHLRFQRMQSPLWPFVRLFEWAICRTANRVLCVSEVDRDHLTERLGLPPDKLQVIPNGVDIESCIHKEVNVSIIRRDNGLSDGESVAFFFGNLDYRPNVMAVENIYREIVPWLDKWQSPVRIMVAGQGGARSWLNRLQERSERVIVVGFVQDITAYIKSADVVIVPLTTGSGTRFKIVESVGCGCRVVSTGIGAEGLDRRVFGDGLVIRDHWKDFAQGIAETAKLGPLSPSQAFIETYDWDHIIQKLET